MFAVGVFFTIFFNSAYAQTVVDQTTLSGDLQNNPVAQDILKKIEQSKAQNIQKYTNYLIALELI